MTILKLRQANNPESTTKLAYIRELQATLTNDTATYELLENNDKQQT